MLFGHAERGKASAIPAERVMSHYLGISKHELLHKATHAAQNIDVR